MKNLIALCLLFLIMPQAPAAAQLGRLTYLFENLFQSEVENDIPCRISSGWTSQWVGGTCEIYYEGSAGDALALWWDSHPAVPPTYVHESQCLAFWPPSCDGCPGTADECWFCSVEPPTSLVDPAD